MFCRFALNVRLSGRRRRTRIIVVVISVDCFRRRQLPRVLCISNPHACACDERVCVCVCLVGWLAVCTRTTDDCVKHANECMKHTTRCALFSAVNVSKRIRNVKYT